MMNEFERELFEALEAAWLILDKFQMQDYTRAVDMLVDIADARKAARDVRAKARKSP